MFQQLVAFLQQKQQLKEVMIQQVRDIETLSADWNLTKLQRVDLYFKCAQALSQEGDHGHAFRVFYQAFNLVGNEKGDWKAQAEQLVLSALRSPQTVNIEEVLLFNAVKELKTNSQQIFKLVELINSADVKKFNSELKTFQKLLDEHKIEAAALTQKKQFLTICSIDLEKQRKFSFKEFADMLDLKADEVEEWTITAVTNDIIDAQIDQIEEQIHINSHKLRCMTADDWKKLLSQVQNWKLRFHDNFVKYLEAEN